MEQGVKLLNNRNLYHLDDSESIIFSFSSFALCRFLGRARRKCCWIILCVVFECEDYSRVRCYSPPVELCLHLVKFSATALVSLFALLFFSHAIKTSCLAFEWKWQSFFCELLRVVAPDKPNFSSWQQRQLQHEQRIKRKANFRRFIEP